MLHATVYEEGGRWVWPEKLDLIYLVWGSNFNGWSLEIIPTKNPSLDISTSAKPHASDPFPYWTSQLARHTPADSRLVVRASTVQTGDW